MDRKVSKKKEIMKKPDSLIKKPFLTGFYSMLILIFLSFAMGPILVLLKGTFVEGFFSVLFQIVNLVLIFFIYYSLYYLGKVYNSKLLKVLSVLMLVITFIFSFSASFYDYVSLENGVNDLSINYNSSLNSLDSQNLSEADYDLAVSEVTSSFLSELFELILPLIILGVILAITYFILIILWGVAFYKLRSKVKYAKVLGLIYLWSAFTFVISVPLMLILVGFFTFLLATIGILAGAILEIMVLYDQAKKFGELK